MRQLWTLAPILLVACLSYDKFQDKYAEKDCEAGRACDESYPCDFDVTTDLPLPEDCDFDRAAARSCLNTEWTCNDTFPHFEYAVPPASCEAVCTTLTTGPVVTDGENI